MNTEIVELISVSHEVSWLPWAVQYFFLIGLSYAAFLFTLPAFVLHNPALEKVARIALLVALTTGIVAPVALLADLHQPARFMNFYLHFTSGSWMSWGAFFLPAYVTGLMLYAWCIYRPAMNKTRVRALGIFTAIAATLVIIYTGSEVAVVNARPLWNSFFVPLIYLTSAMSGAAGLSLIISRYLPEADKHDVTFWFNGKLVLFSWITLALIIVWLITGIAGLSESGKQLLRLAIEYRPLVFIVVTLLLGMLLPLFLAWRQSTSIATGLLAVMGSWMIRWHLFIDAQRIPKSGAGFYDYEFPLGHEGLMGIVGSFGLWVLVVLLYTHYLTKQNTKHTLT